MAQGDEDVDEDDRMMRMKNIETFGRRGHHVESSLKRIRI